MVSAVQKPGSSPSSESRAPAYPIASVDNALRLMAMLAFHGFVRQEPDSRAYVAGPVLTEIGLAAVRELDIRLHARPALEQLAASLGETAHLAVLEGGQ